MNIVDWFDEIVEDHFDDQIDEILAEMRKILRSSAATNSAHRLNQLFVKNEMKDEAGNFLQVGNPTTIADKLKRDGVLIVASLTDEERRFLSADRLYGDNVLRKLNIKINDKD